MATPNENTSASSAATPIDLESPLQSEPSQQTPTIVYLPLTARHTSGAWQHFKRKRVGEEIKAECNYCAHDFAGGRNAGTNHLHEHTRKCPKRYCQDIKQTRLFGTQAKPTDKSETLTLSPYEFHQEDGRRDLAEMIILHEYPISMVEHYGFRKYSKTLQPGFKVPSRNTTRKDIMNRYREEKENISRVLEKTKSRIALTTDMWTSSNQRKGYMAVTAHWIDSSWKLHSRILRFLYVEAPHTKEVLSDALFTCIYDWNLDCQVSAITLDNCSTNDAAMNILHEKLPRNSLILKGKFLHMRCCAHILNLIVQDGLDVIGDGIERVRNSVVYWTSSVSKVQKFEKAAKIHAPDFTQKLVLDCKTRWNSTYEMLRVAMLYKEVFDILKGRESTYKCAPTCEDWERAAKVCEKLKLFNDVTHEFSASKYPTANIYFMNICEIKLALESWVKSSDSLIATMAASMLEKCNKYWSEVNSLLAVAAVLDPRMKLDFVRYYYQDFYDEFELEDEVVKVRKTLEDLVKEYSATHSKKPAASSSKSMPPPRNGGIGSSKLDGFDRYMETQEKRVTEKSELEKYLDAERVPSKVDLDILAWWKASGSAFPILQKIARDILSIPVSSVASESAFSTGGRVLSPHRSRLLPETVEALMCAQNWIWTNIRGGDELKEVPYHQIIEELEEDECLTDNSEAVSLD